MTYGKDRITLDMSIQDILVTMSDGNPGGLTVMMDTMKNGSRIDPDAAFGGLTVILGFDTHRIYGSDIWILYKDICGQNLARMFAVLRAVQLGIMSEIVMKAAIARAHSHGYGGFGDTNEVNDKVLMKTYAAVKEYLPNFDPDGQGQ